MNIGIARYACLIAAGFVLCACSIGKTKKQDFAYLRGHHAGAAQFKSDQPPRIVFDRVFADAQKCYVGGGVSGIMPVGAGPLFIPFKGPGRQVERKFDDAENRGTVRAFVDGTLYLVIFQIDVTATTTGSDVAIYYDKDVRMQRHSVENLEAWLAGHDDACTL